MLKVRASWRVTGVTGATRTLHLWQVPWPPQVESIAMPFHERGVEDADAGWHPDLLVRRRRLLVLDGEGQLDPSGAVVGGRLGAGRGEQPLPAHRVEGELRLSRLGRVAEV